MTKPVLTVRITSFSYKKGIPEDPTENGGGHVFDCRIIPNPGVLDEYKELTGIDASVGEYISAQPQSESFIKHTFAIVEQSITRYFEREFTHLMVSFGCTGGQHRSVFFAESLAKHISAKYPIKVIVLHREQNITYEIDSNNI